MIDFKKLCWSLGVGVIGVVYITVCGAIGCTIGYYTGPLFGWVLAQLGFVTIITFIALVTFVTIVVFAYKNKKRHTN